MKCSEGTAFAPVFHHQPWLPCTAAGLVREDKGRKASEGEEEYVDGPPNATGYSQRLL